MIESGGLLTSERDILIDWLGNATRWLRSATGKDALPLGYFGASADQCKTSASASRVPYSCGSIARAPRFALPRRIATTSSSSTCGKLR
jgi:hypothetical protein